MPTNWHLALFSGKVAQAVPSRLIGTMSAHTGPPEADKLFLVEDVVMCSLIYFKVPGSSQLRTLNAPSTLEGFNGYLSLGWSKFK